MKDGMGLTEHRQSLKRRSYSRLAEHCSAHGCYPILKEADVLSSHVKKTCREIIEAFHIRRLGDACVSKPSITLCEKEYGFLSSTCYDT